MSEAKIVVRELTAEEKAVANAIVAEAADKTKNFIRCFGSDTKGFFTFALALAVLHDTYSFATDASEIGQRIKEWIVVGQPEDFTSGGIVDAILAQSKIDIEPGEPQA